MAYVQINDRLVELTEEEETAETEARSESVTAMLNVENRNTRNELLAACDWTQFSDSPLTDEAKTLWATYRTALRDLPTNENWPSLGDDDWPSAPE